MTPCVFCGAPSVAGHHPTGRDSDGRYLDPDFKVPACHDDHYLTHDDWYAFGLDNSAGLRTSIEIMEMAMRRLGVLCARLTPQGEVFAGLARWFARNADLLRELIDTFDQRCPGWRAVADQ